VSAVAQRPRTAAPRVRPPAALRAPAVWLAALAFVLYLPPALTVAQLSPDAVEYVDVARRLLAGEGYKLGVKAYHVGGTEVLHDGLAERPPLYPLLLAALLGAGLGLSGAQVVNALLGGACAALVYGLGAALFGRRTGLLAGALSAASPVVLARMIPPMTEALAVSLTLLATWLVVRGVERSSARPFLLGGLVLGLAYLARPTAAVALGVLVVGALISARAPRMALLPVAGLIGGFLTLALPISLHSLATRGALSYSGQTYLYAVFKDSDVLRNGYGAAIPTAAEFIRANPDFVVAAMLENAATYAGLLFLDRDWLLPLLIAWPFALLALGRGRYPRAAGPVLLVALGNFLVYAATWSNYQERYQLLTLLLLLPFAVDGLARIGLGGVGIGPMRALTPLHAVILAVAVFWSPVFLREYRGQFVYGDEDVGTRTDRGLRWTGPPRWVKDNELSRMVDWLDQNTDRADPLAHGQPWPFTFFTGRPATLLPTRLPPERLRSFLADYRVAYVLLDTGDHDRRGYAEALEAWRREGVTVTPVGRHRIFDTRALWHGG
jgi:4-amino-4-deoxy-L-arabinose transferase-like glycosyltransferase